jgi:5-methylcytosine-specific restriction enzyme A
MPLLFHWRGENYRGDRRNREAFTYNLNQNSSTMHRTEPGDTIWAFTRREDGVYVLAVRGVIEDLSMNEPGFHYGIYRVSLDPKQTIYFNVDAGPDVEPVIRSLSITTEARVLGNAFVGRAGVRKITEADNNKLEEFMRHSRPPAV